MSTLQWLIVAWACGAFCTASSVLLTACDGVLVPFPKGAEWMSFVSVCVGWPVSVPLAIAYALWNRFSK